MSNIAKSDGGLLISLIGAKGSLAKPFSREIFLVETHVAGTSYVDNIDDIEEKLIPGTKLHFFREPENIYDNLAIVIKDTEGNKVGYLPKETNQIIARLMDAGKLIYGVVEDKERFGKWVKITIQVYLQD
ncbi:MAG: HIRAN domain-containing protein [Limnochordia bacterium]|jgi:hypothetical protein|nr:HIRAN domain-containing protein [Limnochordia bacterium]MDD2628930.1 HIRAN domain-containing protein [Limnochordia bacterium]MDD4518656.1 HIRAN domain-containing protein [Limnochordia bacterium]